MATLLTWPGGTLELQRYPRRHNEQLQAFNGADRLLLAAAHAELSATALPTLVVNDEHGALSVALNPAAVWNDSWLSAQAIRDNRERNNSTGAAAFIASTEAPAGDLQLLVMRIPKSTAYLEYQLQTLASRLAAGTTILLAGMDKHLPRQLDALLGRFLDDIERHRGQYKAHLFSAVLKADVTAPTGSNHYYCEELDGDLIALPNVFSRDGADIGSRFLMSQYHALPAAGHVIDLACGNGVLGLASLHRGIAQRLTFCDESLLALESTRRNIHNLLPQAPVHYHWGDGLRDLQVPPANLILCNPPFHLQHTVDDYAGKRLLHNSHQLLHSDGELWLVANRHLDYKSTLQRQFRQVDKQAQNNKFVIWRASGPRR